MNPRAASGPGGLDLPFRMAAWGSLLIFLFLLAARGGKIFPVCLAGEGVLAASAGMVLWRRPAAVPRDVLLPLLLLALLQSASAWASPCVEGSFLTLGRFWAAVAFAVLVGETWSPRHRKIFEGILMAAALFQTLLFADAFRRGGGPLLLLPGNVQYICLWIGLAALGSASARKAPPGLRVFLFAALSAGAFLSSNRSILTALSAGLLFLIHDRYGTKGLILGLLAGVFLATAIPSGGAARVLKVSDPAAWKRWDIWITAWRGIFTHPWLGWGPGQFEGLYRLHAGPQEVSLLRFDHETLFAHNDYLQLAAASGLPALLCLVWTLAALFRSSASFPKGEDVAARQAPAAAVLLFSFFNFPFALPVNGLVAGFTAAGLAGPRTTEPPDARRLSRALGLFFLGLAVFLAALLPGSFEPGPPERVFYGRSAVFLERAESLLIRPGADAAVFSEAEGLARRAAAECSGRAEVWHALAAAEGARSSPEAEAALRKALSLRPRNAVWWLDLALVEESRGDAAGALKDVHEALRVEPRFAEAAFHLGRLIRQRGEPAKARRWLERLSRTRRALRVDEASLSPYARRILAWDETTVREEIERCRSDGKDIIRGNRP